MNSKHLAAVLVTIMAVLFIQGAFEVRKHLASVGRELSQAKAADSEAKVLLQAEHNALDRVQKSSTEMLAFLSQWSDAVRGVETPEAGEFHLASRVKESGLLTLSQRFEVVSNKNESAPRLVRAHLTFEDDYARALNWLGLLEQNLPSLRVTDLRVVRGETGNDIRLTLVLDLPLVKQEVAATP